MILGPMPDKYKGSRDKSLLRPINKFDWSPIKIKNKYI